MSLDERFHSGAGIAAQRSAITIACGQRGWELLDIVEDVGFSGRDLKRPAVTAAIGRLDRGEADCLVVAKLDRLSRSLADFVNLVQHANRSRWGVVALDIQVDTTTPAGEAMAHMLATFAQFERRMIGLRSKEAREQLRAQGRVTGTVPYGFRREGKMLVKDPVEQKLVARACHLYAGGFSHTAIADRFNADGLPGRRGGRWSYLSVRRMLRANETVGVPVDRLQPERARVPIYRVPYGYVVRSGELVEEPAEQAALKRMRRMRERSMSFPAIAVELQIDGVPTKQGAAAWSESTVRKLVHRGGAVAPDLPRRSPVHPRPYGYAIRRGRLVTDRREQAVIARIRRMRNHDGMKLYEIAARLQHDGVPGPRGAKWWPGTIKKTLTYNGVIRQHHLGPEYGPSQFKGLVGAPMRELLRSVMGAPEHHQALCLRHANGEVTTRDLVLAALFGLWATALDQAAADRTFTDAQVRVHSGLGRAPMLDALRSLCAEQLVARAGNLYQLTIAGFGAVTDIVDVTGVLAATEPAAS